MNKRKAIPKKLRFEILKRDDFTCQYCGVSSPDTTLHLDHIEPVSKGGTNDPSNLTTSCHNCNIGKSDRLLTESHIAEGLTATQRENRLYACELAHEIFHGVNEERFYGIYDQLLAMDLNDSELLANVRHSTNLSDFSERIAYYREVVFG